MNDSVLRVLYIPDLYTSAKLSGVSLVSAYRHMIDSVNVNGQKVFTYFVGPTADSEWENDIGLDKRKDYEYLAIDSQKDAVGRDSIGICQDVLAFLGGSLERKRAVDIVLTPKFMHMAMLRQALFVRKGRFAVSFRLPMIQWLMESALDPGLHDLQTEDGELICACASILSDGVIVMQDCDRDWLYPVIRNRFSPKTLLEYKNKTDMVPVGVRVNEFEEQFERHKEWINGKRLNDRLVCFHGGSFEVKRHVLDQIKIISELRVLGYEIDLLLSSQYHEKPECVIEATFPIDCRLKQGRDQYIRNMREADVVFITVEHEGTGIAYMEAVCAGLIPIILNKPWTEWRFDSNSPLVCRNIDAIKDVLVWVYRNREQAFVEAEKLRSRIKCLFDSDLVADSFFKKIESVSDIAFESQKSKYLTKAFNDIYFEFDKMGIDELKNVDQMMVCLGKASRSGSFVFGVGHARRMLLARGWRDLGNQGIHLVRGE